MAQNPLGKPTHYISSYKPELLFPIARSEKRHELPKEYLNFNGQDIWNAYELSWLNNKGLPQVAIGEFRVDASSPFIIESKSLKLYLNSFNQTQFESNQQVTEVLIKDLSLAAGCQVSVKLYSAELFNQFKVAELSGELIDNLDVEIDCYEYNPTILADKNGITNGKGQNKKVNETLVSHLLKSNCLITSQPDWASIQISYQGNQINRENLLKYLVSFRSHNEFHEQCVERIYTDIKKYCSPEKLSVYARYTRRGGLDINPWRSDFETEMANVRLARQ